MRSIVPLLGYTPKVSNSGVRQFLIGGFLLTILVGTLAINFYTVRMVAESQTDVLWKDQWWFLGELQSVYEGKNWADVLWSPFWGHRSVISRLLFYLDARFFAFRNAPLLCIGWTSLLLDLALIFGVNRAMFGRFLSWRYAAAIIVTLNLRLSSFQLENLIWAFQFQYPFLFCCATVSFVLLARSVRAKRSGWLVAGSCVSAFIATLTMANGLMVWPTLAVQAVLCKRDRKVWIGLLAAFVALSGIYAFGYWAQEMGMHQQVEWKRPVRALEIALMVLGGPVSNQSVLWGVAAGVVGVLALVVFVLCVYRSSGSACSSVHAAIGLFTVATASLTALGRISPEVLNQALRAGGDPLPSRYLTFAFVFWTSLFSLALWIAGSTRRVWVRSVAVVAALVPGYMVVAYARLQPGAAEAWADTMHSVDATGTSFLVDAPDWERQKLLWANRSQLEKWVAFAREHRLANFAEDRFNWLNRRLTEQFAIAGAETCEGKVESVEKVSETTWRVTGWAWDRSAGKPPGNVVLIGDGGRIRGMARSGIPHHDMGGHSGGVIIWRAGWLGYVKLPESGKITDIEAYAIPKGGTHACRLRLGSQLR